MSTFGRIVCIYLILCAWGANAQNKNTSTSGQCSPIVQNSGGTANVTIDCSQTLSPKEIAKRNLSTMVRALQSLIFTQRLYFMPSLELYAKEPTPENWGVVLADLQRTQKALDTTIDASVDYFGTIKHGTLKGAELANLLHQRSVMLSKLGASAATVREDSLALTKASSSFGHPSRPRPTSQSELNDWIMSYRDLMSQLVSQISKLDGDLDQLEMAASTIDDKNTSLRR